MNTNFQLVNVYLAAPSKFIRGKIYIVYFSILILPFETMDFLLQSAAEQDQSAHMCSLNFAQHYPLFCYYCPSSKYHSKLFNCFPHNPDVQRPQERSLLKTLWEKEKMLVTSIFSFFHSVFYPIKDRNHHLSYVYFVVCKCFQFGHIQNVSFGNELIFEIWLCSSNRFLIDYFRLFIVTTGCPSERRPQKTVSCNGG